MLFVFLEFIIGDIFFIVDIFKTIMLILTIWNIFNCIADDSKIENLISSLTVLLGAVFYYLLFNISLDVGDNGSAFYYRTLSPEYWLIDYVVVLGFIGYFILLYNKANKLSPLLSALSIGTVVILNIFQIAYAFQISVHLQDSNKLIYLYHANILLMSARVIYRHMKEQVEIFRNRLTENEDHKKVGHISNKIDSLSKYSLFIFVVFLLLVALIELIFVLLGQGLDAPIKAFTETADWKFSKYIKPPYLK
ncbi:hypothetical protein SAMN02910406_00160 [Ruminococcus albus]|uniref:DUF6688 domain-containing protein n=2 Tax=Ruminococcus albus TaxID=1264 RepID=A0A1I1D303_RUMAL|nr:hypothetical protein SAMN02910406_00160 [Ruminococcus albus]